ncbi:LTA synthase family protein [Alteromonas sp. 14N.309.X.WAT.G.H12]|uniref:LTA synthase family protein n=1 Tax=Alteromonas sp. 14N.309.X.WAT.G.H12 TaxID=3120824 RepID=UPI002FCECA4B
MTVRRSVLKPAFRLMLLMMTIFFVSRIGLMIWLHTRLESDDWLGVLIGGFRVDLSSLGYLMSVPIFLLMMNLLCYRKTLLFQYVFSLYGTLITTFVLIFELATPAFITQYDVRPNRLFIEYLDYPDEVLSMLLHGHFLVMLITLTVGITNSFFCYRYLRYSFVSSHSSIRVSVDIGYLIGGLLLCLFAARGTLSHRPINPALVYFSQDALVNSLILNSSYSVAFALKNMGNEKNARRLYGSLPANEIINTVQQASYRKTFLTTDIPTLALNKPFSNKTNKNLVIILEESLGARFVGELGGTGITPELDKLYQQGWGFDNLYATGTRSVRGIEAVITGFPPSPSRSVVKLSKSQHKFFSIADVLRRRGYATQFIYGGESHFDNMKSFFLGNGFTDIVDSNDIENPQFTSSWGVSDEDLFHQADIELSKLNDVQQPFFSLIFTSSNHDPFEIPKGKVSLPKGHRTDNEKRDLAIKYADYALGQFMTKAKTKAYWNNTVFLVVADHDVRVYGSEPVPIKSFHIPAIILNSDMGAKRDTRLVSQMDLPVTLLSLLGIEQATPMLGFDLTKHYPVERAMMQYYDNFAYIENDHATILMPDRKVSYWSYDKKNKIQLALDTKGLVKKALAHVLFSNLAYSNQWYRLPNENSDKE